MRPQLQAHASAQCGVVTCRQALAAGYSEKEIRVLLRWRQWVRVRHGAYTLASTWAGAGTVGQHLLRVRAALLAVADDSVASHDSAAVAHDLPTHGLDLSEVRLTRPGGRTTRHQAGVDHHVAHLPDTHTTTVGGLRVTSPARTALDVARVRGFEAGIVAADAALHSGESAETLAQVAELMAEWPGGATSTAVAAAADGRCESPGETLARQIVEAMGYVATPQVVIEAAGARVDPAAPRARSRHRVRWHGQVRGRQRCA